MISRRLAARLTLVATSTAILACRDATGPKQPGTAITYVRNLPNAFVVSSPDGKHIYATYALPFQAQEAELSPDHSQVVISNESAGELWIVSTADGQARMIVGPNSDAAEPSWTPDGKHILFYRATDGGAWLIDSDGSNEHPIGSGSPGYGPQSDPVSSRDGTRIAFDSPFGSAANVYHVYIMNSDGGGGSMLSVPPGNTSGDAWQPAWSPDGRQLAFGRTLDTTTAIWVANVDGSGARAVTLGDHQPWAPTWSPNGDRIAFAVFDGSPEYIAALDLATGIVTELRSGSSASEWCPHWIRWP